MDLKEQLTNYKPYNEQEERDLELILSCIDDESVYTRENVIAHLTASAWVVNRAHTKVLMAFHNIYNSWSWLGGHADGEHDLLKLAMREVNEESGVTDITPVTEDIFSVEVLHVPGHIKRGKYVSSHLHMNVTYLLEADEEELLRVKPDENSNVAWFGLDEAIAASNEEWMCEHIYEKLNARLREMDVKAQ